MARPLRGGGGVGKAGPLRKKITFLGTFFLLYCYLKIKDILLKTIYQNINTANVGKFGVWFVAIFGKIKYGSFSPKIVGRKEVVKIRFQISCSILFKYLLTLQAS